jgi:NAD(P)-dependent dehydrogenase (short-subunit alcohol dehydrogenase family)
MSVRLADAVAVVTGAGSGIGRATAHAFADRGARIVVSDIDVQRAETVAAEIGSQAVGVRCDVTSIGDLEATRDLALDRFGRVDVVMNNVGVVVCGPVLEIPYDAWQRPVDVNLMSIVRSNLVFLPLLVGQGSGHVVNTSSTSGILPYGHLMLPYTATKFAVVGLSEALAVHLRSQGVGVSCVCPAGVDTNIAEHVVGYGMRERLAGPSFPEVAADVVGEAVADAVESDRFLVLSTPEVADELRALGADVDAYLERMVEQYG